MREGCSDGCGQADVAAHEAKVVAVAENKLLGAPAAVVEQNARTTLEEARSDVAQMESVLIKKHS